MAPFIQGSSIRIAGFTAAVHVLEANQRHAPTILALHGFTGSGNDFLPLRDAVGPHSAHWICPDFMGHGQSDSPDLLDPYLLPWAIRLIDAARQMAPDPDRVLLLGYSMGGRIALHYLRHAKALPAILIGASPGLASPVERESRRSSDAKWITLLEQGDANLPSQSPMAAFCEAWESQALIQPQLELPEPLKFEIVARRRQNNTTGLTNSLRGCGTGALPSLWDALGDYPPLTLLYGEKDTKFGRIAKEMAVRNPGFLTRAVPGSGHAPHLEASPVVGGILAEALNTGF